MELTTNQKGYSSELETGAKLLRQGYNISFPYAPCDYDLIAEKDNIFYKIQCKYTTSTKPRKFLTYRVALPYNYSEIDFFMVITPSGFWFIPGQYGLGKNEISLTVNPRSKFSKYRDNFEALKLLS